MTPEQEKAYEKDFQRASRLLAFVKAEILDMNVHARLGFTTELFNYLTPELKELIRKGAIKTP